MSETVLINKHTLAFLVEQAENKYRMDLEQNLDDTRPKFMEEFSTHLDVAESVLD